MPSTVGSLFAAASAKPQGTVRWRQGIPPPRGGGSGRGIYVVSLTPATDRLDGTLPTCPISTAAVRALLEARPELRLDGGRPDVTHLGERLASFWCPDEVVLYVGRAGPRKRVMVSELADRVTEYCTTPLGARSPHAGGWPLKTLANLNEVYVHFAYCANYIFGSRCALVDATQRRLAPRRRMRPWAQLPSQYSCAVDQASRAAIRPVALASRSPCSKWMPP